MINPRLIDNFNRADDSDIGGGIWTPGPDGAVTLAAPAISSNGIIGGTVAGAVYKGMRYNKRSHGPRVGAGFKYAAVESNARVWTTLSVANHMQSAWDGYEIEVRHTGTFRLRLYKNTGTVTQLEEITTAPGDLSSTSAFWLELTPTAVEVWHKGSGGVWTLLHSEADTTFRSTDTRGSWSILGDTQKIDEVYFNGDEPRLNREQLGWAVGGIPTSVDATRLNEISTMAAAGLKYARFDFGWETVATTGWAQYDETINDFTAAGVKIIGMIGGDIPASERPGSTNQWHPPTSNANFGDFCESVVNRYKNVIKMWEIWNEPNIQPFWSTATGPSTGGVAKYTAMLQDAYPKMKAEDPYCTVLAGAFSPAVSGGTDLDPRDYLTDLYAAGAGAYFDALSHHAYYGPHPISNYQDWSAWSQMYVPSGTPTTGGGAMLKQPLRQIMIANGDSAKKIHVTETGMKVDSSVHQYWTSDEARQTEIYQEALDHWAMFDWAGVICHYNYRNDYPDWSLQRTDLTLRPAYNVLADYPATETVNLTLTPSGIDVLSSARRGRVYWSMLNIPVAQVFEYVDIGTVSLRLTPSAVEVYTGSSIYHDEATVTFRLRPSSIDIGATHDIGTVYVRLLPDGDEEHFAAPPPEVPPEPIIGYTPPPPRIRSWKILHKSGANELGEVYPENLRFGTFLSKPGYVNYEVDMEHPLGRQEFTQPFFTDWELRRGPDILKDLAGFHTEVQVSEDETTFLQVAGQTWLHYFEHIFWPFNPTDPLQYAYTAAATDLFTIVDAILDQVLAQSDALSFTYTFGTSGQTTNFKITPGDQESIFSKIEQLSKLSPGFDLYVTPTREIKLYAPKKGIERNLVFEFHGIHRNIELVNFTDKGSKSVLKGFGSANSQRAGYVSTTTGRRRYEEMKDYGEVVSQESLEALVAADQDRLEVANFQFSVRWTGRDEMDDLLDQVDVGDTVAVFGDTGYNFVDGEYRIVGIEGEVSNEADAVYTVTFDDGTLSL